MASADEQRTTEESVLKFFAMAGIDLKSETYEIPIELYETEHTRFLM
jgi:hypothetical protein